MAQFVKHLLHKHEKLSPIPKTSIEKAVLLLTFAISNPGWSWLAALQPNPETQANERSCLKKKFKKVG